MAPVVRPARAGGGARAPVLLLAAAGLAVVGGVAAVAGPVEVCVAPKYQALIGRPSSGFEPWKWSHTDAMHYVVNDALRPGAPIVVLLALCVLTLLAMLIWRCVRCCCVVCCQKEAYAEPGKVLWGRKLRIWKCAMLLFGIACIGVGTWGILTVPRDLASEAWAVVDDVEAFASSVASSVEGVSRLAGGLTAPLDQIKAVVSADVNVDGLRRNLSVVAAFLDGAPSPAHFKQAIVDLDTALRTSLRPALAALAPSAASTSGPLAALGDALDAAAGFVGSPLLDMDDSLDTYSLAVQGALSANPQPPDAFFPGDPAADALIEAQAAVSPNTWLGQVDAAVAALTVVGGMAASAAANPFAALVARISDADAAVSGVLPTLLPAVVSDLAALNGLFYRNASVAMHGLLAQAVHINSTVIVLPAEVVAAVASLNDTLLQLDAIYDGTPSPLTLAANLSSLRAQLSLPDIDLDFVNRLSTAAAALSSLAPSVAGLSAALGGVSNAMSAMAPKANAVGAALTAFRAGTSGWASVRAALVAGGPAIAAAAAAVAAADSGAGPAATPLASLLDSLSSSAAARLAIADSIAATVRQIDAAPGAAGFTIALDAVQPAYDALGQPPSKALAGVTSLLDSIDRLTGPSAADVHRRVADTRRPLDRVAEMVRGITTKVDGVRAWLVPRVAEYQSYAYGGLVGAYGLVVALAVATMLASWRNCPAALVTLGFASNLVLLLFSLLPLALTVLVVALRDGCANAELAVRDLAASSGLGGGIGGSSGSGGDGNGSVNVLLLAADYYLGDAAEGARVGAEQAIGAAFAVAGLKARINSSVAEALALTAQYTLQPQVMAILGGVQPRIDALMAAADAAMGQLNFTEVRPLYERAKGLFCCTLARVAYSQWASTLALAFLAWLCGACALAVLRLLDSVTGGCCSCVCLHKRDYEPGAVAGARPRSGLSCTEGPPRLGTLAALDSLDSAVVAQVTISHSGGRGGGSKAGSFIVPAAAARYAALGASATLGTAGATLRAPPPERPASAPAYPGVNTSAPPVPPAVAAGTNSPRCYPDLSAFQPAAQQQQQQQQQRGQGQVQGPGQAQAAPYPQVWVPAAAPPAPGQRGHHLPLAEARSLLFASEPSAPPAPFLGGQPS